MLSLSKHYKKAYLFSGLLLLASVVFLFVFGLRLGIDFTGGSLLQLKFESQVDSKEITTVLTESNLF